MLNFKEYIEYRDDKIEEGLVKNIAIGTALGAGGIGGALGTGALLIKGIEGHSKGIQDNIKRISAERKEKLEKERVKEVEDLKKSKDADNGMFKVHFTDSKILVKKMIKPSIYIGNNVDNKNKFANDLASFKTYIGNKSNQGDKLGNKSKQSGIKISDLLSIEKHIGKGSIGMEMDRDKFENIIKMYVISDEDFDKNHKGADGVAFSTGRNKNDPFIVLPSRMFSTLPTDTTDGILTRRGAEVLRHELRHTTQIIKDIGRGQSEAGNKYMNDPAEMGVRLATIRNINDKSYLMELRSKYLSSRNITSNARVEKSMDVLKEFIDKLPEDELARYKYLFGGEGSLGILTDPIDGYPNAEDNLKSSVEGTPVSGVEVTQRRRSGYSKNERSIFVLFKDMISDSHEVSSIFDFIDSLEGMERQEYINELYENYMRVVQSRNFYKKMQGYLKNKKSVDKA